MAAFDDAVARQQAAIFDRLGADATWDGSAEPVRVIQRDYDDDVRIGRAAIIAGRVIIKVRKSEIATPEADHVVIIGSDSFKIIGDPMLDRKKVWNCDAAPVVA